MEGKFQDTSASCRQTPLWCFFLDRRFVLAEPWIYIPISRDFQLKKYYRWFFIPFFFFFCPNPVYLSLKIEQKTLQFQGCLSHTHCAAIFVLIFRPTIQVGKMQVTRKWAIWLEAWWQALSCRLSSHLRSQGLWAPLKLPSASHQYPPHPMLTQAPTPGWSPLVR